MIVWSYVKLLAQFGSPKGGVFHIFHHADETANGSDSAWLGSGSSVSTSLASKVCAPWQLQDQEDRDCRQIRGTGGTSRWDTIISINILGYGYFTTKRQLSILFWSFWIAFCLLDGSFWSPSLDLGWASQVLGTLCGSHPCPRDREGMHLWLSSHRQAKGRPSLWGRCELQIPHIALLCLYDNSTTGIWRLL